VQTARVAVTLLKYKFLDTQVSSLKSYGRGRIIEMRCKIVDWINLAQTRRVVGCSEYCYRNFVYMTGGEFPK